MGKKKVILYPQVQRKLADLGYRIKMARLRRRLSVNLVAERAKVSRYSVAAVERGEPSVAMGIYVAVLMATGLLGDLDLVAKDDILGHTLQDMALPQHIRKKEE